MESYNEFINSILESRGRFACGDEYHERHHIVPKCCGGADDKENLIDLYASEHFKAHKLLSLENPDNDKLINAWVMMAFVKDKNQKRYELNANEYEEAKIAMSKLASIRFSGEKNHNYGKHLSEETRKKMSENHADISGKNNPFYGKTHSDETREKMKMNHANLSGENSPLYGKVGEQSSISKMIYQYDKNGNFIRLWYGSYEIHREIGVDSSSVIKCCNHRPRYKTAGGFQWFYADDPTQPDKSHIITQQNDLQEERPDEQEIYCNQR